MSSLSSHCFANPPVLCSTSGLGNIQTIGGLNSYVTGHNSDSKRAIIFISDVFGYEAPKLRKLADKIAEEGNFFVVVPDFLYGDPLVLNDQHVFDIESWIKVHTPEKASEDAKLVAGDLKGKGYNAIGAAGFCWGGMAVVKMSNSSGIIQAAVVLHPGQLKEEDVNEVKVHTAILGGEIDEFSPPEKVKRAKEILSSNSEIDSFVKIFPRAVHGWTIRYNDDDKVGVKMADEAHLDMLNWFTKYVN